MPGAMSADDQCSGRTAVRDRPDQNYIEPVSATSEVVSRQRREFVQFDCRDVGIVAVIKPYERSSRIEWPTSSRICAIRPSTRLRNPMSGIFKGLPLARPGVGDTRLASASRTRAVSVVSIQRPPGARRGTGRNESGVRFNGDFRAGVWRGVEVEPATVQGKGSGRYASTRTRASERSRSSRAWCCDRETTGL